MSRRALTLLGLVGLTTLLMLLGGAFAGEWTLQGGYVLPGFGPLTEVTLAPVEDKDVRFLAKSSSIDLRVEFRGIEKRPLGWPTP